MRTVYLDSIEPGDITGKYDTSGKDRHFFELRNRRGDTVFFINPKLKRTLTRGVIITDEECTRLDRVFGSRRSIASVVRGAPPRRNNR